MKPAAPPPTPDPDRNASTAGENTGMLLGGAIRRHPWLYRAASLLWVVVLGVALWALRKQLKGVHLGELSAAFDKIGPRHFGIALACTALSYVCNSLLDVMALRAAGLRTPLGSTLRTAFIASTFSINAGGTILGGGSIRLRSYTAYGLTPLQIAGVMLSTSVACWAGYALNAGALLWLAPAPPPGLPHWLNVPWAAPVLVIGAVMASLGYMGLVIRGWKPRAKAAETAAEVGESDDAATLEEAPAPAFRWRHLLIPLATLVSAVDWLLAGITLWCLLPTVPPLAIATFLAAVALAQALSAFSHVPAGAGVLEFTVSALVGKALGPANLAGALVAFRVVYYLLPFALAAGLLASREIWAQRHRFEVAAKVWSALAPRLTAGMALVGGFVLLASADTPVEAARRSLLEAIVPLPFVEASHFISSICGVLLIIIAHGLFNRINAAWWLSIVLAAMGAIFSLIKGFDWEEALLLTFFVCCLLPFRDHFHRHAALFSRRFTLEWWLLIFLLVSVATWLGFFSARHVQYAHELWWQFTYNGDAPRLLRALAAVSGILIVVVGVQLLRPSRPRAVEPQAVPWEEVQTLVNRSATSESQLALLGDKQFFFSADRTSALMYADQGRTRVALRDPLGSEANADELVWRFMEEAQNEGFRPAFYQISAANMYLYVDLGLRLYKLGEEALLDLEKFSLAGGSGKKWRLVRSKFAREGWTFAIWSPEEVAANLGVLREISDEWLAAHRAQEKGFSLGRFDESYITRFPCAVALKDGVPAAFANLWQSGAKEQLSVDLMRYRETAPRSIMDFLFTELLCWGKEQGFARFNFGMAPLAGVRSRFRLSLWSWVASLIFQHGEAFYNFQGLRDYKQKFHPTWEPRYLAVRGRWDLPTALADITSLIGGGWTGVIKKGDAKPGEPEPPAPATASPAAGSAPQTAV